MKTTETDERALRLLATYGGAKTVGFRMYWLCGKQRIAKATIHRLTSASLAQYSNDRLTVTPTKAGARDGYTEDELPDGPDNWYDVGPGAPPDQDEPGDPEVWTCPDARDQFGRVMPVDQAMED